MKVLLFLNGVQGWQTGIEDGFDNLLLSNKITQLEKFYFEDYFKKNGKKKYLTKILSEVIKFQPNFIIFFHIGKFPIDKLTLENIKKIDSKPMLVYDEGDMYGTWAKRITKSMRTIISLADMVSIRGLGTFYNSISKINKNIIYTPHHSDISRFETEPYLLESKENKISLVGNRIKSNILGSIKRLPGAKEREEFVKYMGALFSHDFNVYGHGWDNFIGNKGKIEFQRQFEVYKNSWITVAYEHYPNIPYYFSNRLPIALQAGSLYVCHYHDGYENIFKDCDFIFFFKSNDEARDIIKYIFSLPKDELIERSKRARDFSLRHYHPNVIWEAFFNQIINYEKNI